MGLLRIQKSSSRMRPTSGAGDVVSYRHAVYTALGSVLRAAGASNSRYIGNELDFLLNWQIDRHLNVYVGYSHFFAGTFIQQTGAHKDIDFAYTAVTYRY